VLNPITTSGNLCTENALATAQPPVGATAHQWYHSGVALPGQTGTTLDISAQGLGGGMYAMTSFLNGQCVLGETHVPASNRLTPVISTTAGCSPLSVTFGNGIGDSSAM